MGFCQINKKARPRQKKFLPNRIWPDFEKILNSFESGQILLGKRHFEKCRFFDKNGPLSKDFKGRRLFRGFAFIVSKSPPLALWGFSQQAP